MAFSLYIKWVIDQACLVKMDAYGAIYIYIFFVICLFFQQCSAVLRIHYLQSLNLQKKKLQYLQYITYSDLLTIHVTVITIYYLQYMSYNSLINVHVTERKLNTKQIVVN